MSITRDKLLGGKRVVVTGAGKGIGRSVSLAVAKDGADVCAISRTKEDIDGVLNEIRNASSVNAFGIAGDISVESEVSRMIADASNSLGGIDALVCAAGYPLKTELWEKSLHNCDVNDFVEIFRVDVLGSFLAMKFALPIMIRQKAGVIIAFSSTPALSGYSRGCPYTVAKAANLGMIKDVAAEYGRFNIRAYAVAPGNIATSRTYGQLSDEEKTALADESPMKRWGNADEVGEAVSALISDKFSFVTGQTIVVDGGTVML